MVRIFFHFIKNNAINTVNSYIHLFTTSKTFLQISRQRGIRFYIVCIVMLHTYTFLGWWGPRQCIPPSLFLNPPLDMISLTVQSAVLKNAVWIMTIDSLKHLSNPLTLCKPILFSSFENL